MASVVPAEPAPNPRLPNGPLNSPVAEISKSVICGCEVQFATTIAHQKAQCKTRACAVDVRVSSDFATPHLAQSATRAQLPDHVNSASFVYAQAQSKRKARTRRATASRHSSARSDTGGQRLETHAHPPVGLGWRSSHEHDPRASLQRSTRY